MDISGFGLRVNVRANRTFPQGYIVTQFADDTDPMDQPAMQIADKAMGLNGDLIVWSKPAAIVISLAVIAGSDDDLNLSVLFEANRVAKGKRSAARDVITLNVMYADGNSETFTQGAMTDGIPGNPVASSGRKKTKVYTFAFENKVSATSAIQAALGG